MFCCKTYWGPNTRLSSSWFDQDENGKRLAKRHDAKAIRKYREDGATPADIRRMVGL